MPSLSLGERGAPQSPTMSLELPVRSRRRSRRVRRSIAHAVSSLLALVVVAFVLPPAFGLSRSTVTDDDMAGTIDRGSAVFAKPRPVADLKVGDVITYPVPSASGSRLVTRRIADIEAGVIWTRGDSTGAPDPRTLTAEQSTEARAAVMHVPYAGYAYDALVGGSQRLWRSFSELA